MAICMATEICTQHNANEAINIAQCKKLYSGIIFSTQLFLDKSYSCIHHTHMRACMHACMFYMYVSMHACTYICRIIELYLEVNT